MSGEHSRTPCLLCAFSGVPAASCDGGVLLDLGQHLPVRVLLLERRRLLFEELDRDVDAQAEAGDVGLEGLLGGYVLVQGLTLVPRLLRHCHRIIKSSRYEVGWPKCVSG